MPLYNRSQVCRLMIGLLIGLVLPALDQSIVITALNNIALNLGDAKLQWLIVSAYLLPVLVAGPVYGKISDVYGRKSPYIFSTVSFTVGSALCGVAWSMGSLALFRFIQGIGGGGVVVLTLAFLGDALEVRKRASYQSFFSGIFILGGIAGPALGGLFAGRATILNMSGWRWIFEINVPFGLIATILIGSLPDDERFVGKSHTDWQGIIFLLLWLVPLLAAIQGMNGLNLQSLIFVYLVTSLAGLMLLIVAEVRAGPNAILPLGFLLNREFSAIAGILFLTSCTRGGTDVIVPLILQLVDGLTPAESGLAILPQVVAMTLGTVVAGHIAAHKGNYQYTTILGTLLIIITLAVMPLCDWNALLIAPILLMYGFGTGLMQNLPWAMQNAAGVNNLGVASSASSFFSRLGAILGSALFLNLVLSSAATFEADMSVSSRPHPTKMLERASPQKELRPPAIHSANERKDQAVRKVGGDHASNAGLANSASYVVWLAALINALALYACRYLPATQRAEGRYSKK